MDQKTFTSSKQLTILHFWYRKKIYHRNVHRDSNILKKNANNVKYFIFFPVNYKAYLMTLCLVCAWACACHSAHVWKSKDNLEKPVLTLSYRLSSVLMAGKCTYCQTWQSESCLRNHMVGGDNELFQVVLWPLYACHGTYIPPHKSTK